MLISKTMGVRFLCAGVLSVFSFFMAGHAFASSSVTVGYPNGGQCFVPGSPVAISWSGAEYDHVAIAYRAESEGAPPTYMSSPSSWNIAHPVSGGTYNWTSTGSVPINIPYRIWIEAHNASHGMLAVDSSDMSFGFASSCGSSGGTSTSTSDTIAPTAPYSVSAYALSSSGISVSWSGATDNMGVTGYKIYRNGVYLTYTSSLSYQDAGLLASTPYSYTIAAYDAAGNVGPQSVITSVVTSPALITPTMLSGKAVNASGVGVANVWVNAEQSMNGTFVQTKTGTDGSYALTVSAGDWSVNAYPEQSLGYNYAQGARRITVLAGVAVTVHFTLDSLDAQITGSIVDAAGQVISTAYGYVSTASSGVYSSSTAATTMSFGGSIDKGIFSFHVPQGTYALSVYFPSNSAIAPPPPQTVTVGTGEIKKINFVVGKSDATISGFLKDAFGNVIVNLDPAKVNVYVSSHAGAWYNANTDVSKGTFSAQVAAGTWYLGYWVDVATGYVSQTDDSEVTVNSGEKRSVDLALVRSNSSIAGTVKAADGKPLAGAWVSVDQRSFSAAGTLSQTTTGVSSFMVGGNSDANGAFRVSVPQGTYFVHAYLPATSGYINPPEATVTVVSGQTASVAIVFKKPDAFVSGMITSNGKGVAAFVWAWAESGGYANARADSQGKYSLTASRNQRWHIAASLESAGAFFKASDSVIDIKDESALTQDIVVLPVVMSAQAVERVVETVKPQAIELSDGAKAILPANALAASGSANVSMKPSVETPSFGSSSVVGTSYQVEAKDTGGTSITTLNSDMTITIPYDEKELEAKGLRPEDLALSFFDEATGAWKSLEKQVVDKTSKTVSGTVAHLTLFALVAPADTTPPQAPAGVSVSVSSGTVTLAWKNPSADFHHVKIYRSTKEGDLGAVAFNYLTGTSKSDTFQGVVAYYTVRAIDLAGNESSNTTQYKAQEGMTATSGSSSSKVLLIKIEGDSRVYAVVNNVKRHIPTADAFIAAGFLWGDIKTVTAGESAAYPTSNLLKTSDSPKVYAVENGKKRWIKSAEEFIAGGYKWNLITEASLAELAAYADAVQAAAVSLARDLKLGARGNDVRTLQQTLAKDKSVYPEGKITGYYGKLTQSAVQRFQRKYGIPETPGAVGPDTRGKINELSRE